MCTLVVATRIPGAEGLAVVANRDEQLGRPAAPPSVTRRAGRRILAPRDLKAGGTWLGVNDCDLFAGLTNRFGLTSRPDHRSRGLIVFDALECEDARTAAARIGGMEPDRHSGFHLIVADPDEAFAVVSDTTRIATGRLEPAVYVVTERSFGAGDSERLERMGRRVASIKEWNEATRDQVREWMSEHRDEPLESTCVHAADRKYGTRSSTIVEIGATRRFVHADGPPCSTPFRDLDDELAELVEA